MGISASSSAVVGIRLNITAEPKTVRGCGHDIQPGAVFCGICGKPTTIRQTPEEALSEARSRLEDKFRDMYVTYVDDFDCDSNIAIVGVGVEGSEHVAGRMDIPDIEAVKHAIAKRLGLSEHVVAKAMGIWSVAHISD